MSLLAVALVCTPALPFYCGNIHVGCAGRSTRETSSFEISDQAVTFEDAEEWEISLTTDRDALILRRTGSNDWIRIEQDERFSLRRYVKGHALMTRGTCRQVPAATR